MARKSKELTPAQSSAVDLVRQAVEARNKHKQFAEAEIRARVAAEQRELEMNIAIRARDARELGVPITRIGSEGMGTSDPHTPRRYLAMTEALTSALGKAEDALPFRWLDEQHTTVAVNIRGFVDVWDHDERRATDWPDPMRGSAKRDPAGPNDAERRSGWVVVNDAQGLNQWFTTMVQARSGTGTQGETLPVMLQRWAEDNA